MFGHGALGEFSLGGFEGPLTAVDERAQRLGGGPGLLFAPTAQQVEDIREAALRAQEARDASAAERRQADEELRREIDKNFLISIGAWHEPWVWPDVPHPEADLSALAFDIGGAELRDRFDRLVYEINRAQTELDIMAEEDDIALLVAMA